MVNDFEPDYKCEMWWQGDHLGQLCQCAACWPFSTHGCPGCDECDGPVELESCYPEIDDCL